MVVVDGADRLREGAKVEVITREAPSRRAARSAAAARTARRRAAGKAPRGTARRRQGPAPSSSGSRHESVAPVHPAAGRDHAVDGRDPARGHRRVPRAAAVRAARGRLPDDPGGHAVSRREPGRDDLVDHRAAGAPVRPDAGPEPDVVDELGRRVGDHAAVQPRAAARRGRAGSAGGDQRGVELPADRPAAARRSTTRSIRPTRRSSRSR